MRQYDGDQEDGLRLHLEVLRRSNEHEQVALHRNEVDGISERPYTNLNQT